MKRNRSLGPAHGGEPLLAPFVHIRSRRDARFSSRTSTPVEHCNSCSFDFWHRTGARSCPLEVPKLEPQGPFEILYDPSDPAANLWVKE